MTIARSPVRSLLITPHYRPLDRGNAVTVARLEQSLTAAGCQVLVCAVTDLDAGGLLTIAREFRPDVVHAFHAWAGGRSGLAVSRALGCPLLVTLTGTDVYQALEDERREESAAVLAAANGLVAFHASVGEELARTLPEQAARLSIIPQGVVLPPLAELNDNGDRELLLLLPAGLRPVKGVEFPLEPLAALVARLPGLRLQLVGPVLDAAYAERLLAAVSRYPFARYLGSVEHGAMGELYRRAAVVLNCSLAEGGMANSVLEGMAWGRALLASDIPANRAVIADGVTGMLYRNRTEFRRRAAELLEDADLRRRLGDAARRFVAAELAPEKEAAAYLVLYRRLLAGGNG